MIRITTNRERGGSIFSAIGSMAEAVKEKLTVSGEDDLRARSGTGSRDDVILRAKDVDIIEPAGRDSSKQGKM